MSKSAAGQPLYIPSLDGLRAFSILVVFVSHCGLAHLIPGLFGVTVFFFLSGYLITTLLRLEAAKHGQISLGQFYLRRGLRILPPLYLTLGAFVLLALLGWLKADFTWGSVFAQAFYTFNYYGFAGSLPGTGVLWSLAVEEHFYLLFPLFYIGLRRWLPQPRRQFILMAGICAAVLAWRLVQAHVLGWVDPATDWARTGYTTDSRLDSILFGCMLAVWGNPFLDEPGMSKRVCLGLALPAGVLALLFTFVHRDLLFRETLRYTIQGLALFPVFIAAVRYPSWGPLRLFSTSVMKYVGLLSYSLYLIHHTLIHAFLQWLPHSGRFIQSVAALATALAVASVLYHGVEKPLARLRRRFSKVGGLPAPQPQAAVSASS
jgi:peptidoglycan/LPS O-acetylase OafA/YrhL